MKSPFFCFLISILILYPCFSIFAETNESEDFPEYFPYSTQVAGSGGGGMLPTGSEYMLNPSLVMLRRSFTVSGAYFFKKSGSVTISDSKTSKVGGGMAYSGHDGLNSVKMNFAFPLFSFLFGGISYNHYTGNRHDIQKKVNYCQVVDFGISASLGGYVLLGFAVSDLLSFTGPYLPAKLNFQAEIPIVRDMLSFNTAFVFHPEYKKEFGDNRRDFMNFTDAMAGLEFRYKIISISTGLYNSSYNPKFNFATTLKTFSMGFFGENVGGIYGGYYFRKGFHSFSINIVWDIDLKN
ncbi:MAG: hypothetical protein R6W70_09810 [bacterium]